MLVFIDDLSSSARVLFNRIQRHLEWRKTSLHSSLKLAFNQWFGNLWYDKWLKRQSRLTRGSLSISDRCAVYVLYPRLGLQASHLVSLTYLVKKGFTPLVVSNLPLGDHEREQLLPLCWQLLERPNYGYDFGAYRDGVLMALESLSSLSQLVLANDSVWFPIPADSDWLTEAQNLNVDLAGAASNDGWTEYLADPSRLGSWKYDPHAPRLHYCSFALLFGPRILSDPNFVRFWRNLKLTSDKYQTIQRGEIGLSRWVIDRGYSHAASLDLRQFDKHIERMDLASLRALAAYLIIPEDAVLRDEQSEFGKLPTELVDPIVLKRFVLWSIAATGPAYAVPYWSLNEKGFGFLKKSPMWLSEATAKITESLIQRYGDSGMLAEARLLRKATILDKP